MAKGGAQLPVRPTASVPARAAAPVAASLPFCPEALKSMSSRPVAVCVKAPSIESVPTPPVPGRIVAALVTSAFTVPVPWSVPPCSEAFPTGSSTPPARVVVPAVCM